MAKKDNGGKNAPQPKSQPQRDNGHSNPATFGRCGMCGSQ